MKQQITGGTAHPLTEELEKALSVDREALTLWEGLTPLARNEWICWVTYPKKEEIKQEHIVRTISELKEGMRRPCCWMGCIHRKDKKLSPSVKGILDKKSNKDK